MKMQELSYLDRQKIVAALDCLALALTSKNHKWSATERKVYDIALYLLKN